MSKAQIKKIVKKYANKLKKEKFPFSAIYLYGSFAKEKAHKWSDIDIAVISDELEKKADNNELKLWEFREEIDSRIEPIGFTKDDFKDINNPIVWEIRNTGIKVV